MNFNEIVNELAEVKNTPAQLKPTIDETGTYLLGTPCKLTGITFKTEDRTGNKLKYPNMELVFEGTDPNNNGQLKQIIWGSTFDKDGQYYSEPKETFAVKLLTQFLQAYIPNDNFMEGMKQVMTLTEGGNELYPSILQVYFKGGIFNVEYAKTIETELAIVLSYNEKGFEILSNKFKKSFNTQLTPNNISIKIDGRFIKVKPEVADEEPDGEVDSAGLDQLDLSASNAEKSDAFPF